MEKKKSLGFILLLLAVALILPGCAMKMNAGLEISKDKEVKATIISAMDDEMIDAMINMSENNNNISMDNSEQKKHTDKERWEYVENNTTDDYDDYEKQKYDQDGFKGYIYTKKLGKVDDLSTDSNKDKVSMSKMDEDSNIFIKNGDKYILNIQQDQDSNYAEQKKQYEQYGAVFDVKFTVTLPNKAISSNATSVSKDGLTYTWDLLETNDIKLEFLYAKFNMLLIAIIGGCALVVIILIIVLATKGKNKGDNGTIQQNNIPTEPVQPVMPQAPVEPQPTMSPQGPTVERPVEPQPVDEQSNKNNEV